MPLYAYRARGPTGAPLQGTLETPSLDEAALKLKRMGYYIVSLRPTLGFPSFAIPREWFERVQNQDIVLLTLQVSDMVASGLTLVTNLETIEQQSGKKAMKAMVAGIRRALEEGQPFSAGLQKYPRIFTDLYVQTVRAGEASGNLDIVLKRLAQYLENREELRRRFVSALTYPLILLCATLAVSAVIVAWVIPGFVQVFARSGMTLPWPTRVLHKTGLFLNRFWWTLPGVLALLAGGFKLWRRRPGSRLLLDRFLLKIPRLGELIRREMVARFTSTLGLLASSGVPILESLDLSERTLGNAAFEEAVRGARRGVSEGMSLSQSLKVSGELPADAMQMITVGEESGHLDTMLEKTAEIYNRTVEYSLKRLTALLEPAMLVFMGALVGTVMLSVFLPLLNMMKFLKRR